MIAKHLILATVLALTAAASANAGYLVQNGTITRVYNTSNNQNAFAVNVQGGTGPCTSTVIVFPLSAAADADTHKRAYAAALMAFAMGLQVSIYNYTNDTCTIASYIDVSQ